MSAHCVHFLSFSSQKTCWWLDAENPWQTLATCFELHAATQLENPEDFCSSLPVHQDGTCNGLQHYAALGGDVEGARHVNLSSNPDDDRPQDVYSAVARVMDGLIEEHIRSGTMDPSLMKVKEGNEQLYLDIAAAVAKQGPLKRKVPYISC